MRDDYRRTAAVDRPDGDGYHVAGVPIPTFFSMPSTPAAGALPVLEESTA
jgi:hypothetical protein